MVAFSAYGVLVRHVAPAKVATYAYVNPVVAVLLGAVFGGEALPLRGVAAGGGRGGGGGAARCGRAGRAGAGGVRGGGGDGGGGGRAGVVAAGAGRGLAPAAR